MKKKRRRKQRQRQKIVIAAIAAVVVALVLVFVLSVNKKDGNESTSESVTKEETTLKDNNDSGSSAEITEKEASDKDSDKTKTQNSAEENTEGASQENFLNSETVSEGEYFKEESVKDAETLVEIKFPYKIPNTSLVVQKIDSYDGQYLEDGSHEEKNGVATILVKNTGSSGIEYADVCLKNSENELHFSVSLLEAGASCIVQEKNAISYKNDIYHWCTAEIADVEAFDMSEESVKVSETKSGMLAVKNVSNEKIPCIRVFYKNYDQDSDMYVGGIAYTAKVVDLESGFTTLVTPENYVAGQSKIMMVRIYAAEE